MRNRCGALRNQARDSSAFLRPRAVVGPQAERAARLRSRRASVQLVLNRANGSNADSSVWPSPECWNGSPVKVATNSSEVPGPGGTFHEAPPTSRRGDPRAVHDQRAAVDDRGSAAVLQIGSTSPTAWPCPENSRALPGASVSSPSPRLRDVGARQRAGAEVRRHRVVQRRARHREAAAAPASGRQGPAAACGPRTASPPDCRRDPSTGHGSGTTCSGGARSAARCAR